MTTTFPDTFPDVSISTERLCLRPFDEEDVPALAEMMNDELVIAWSPVNHPYTRADAHHWVTSSAPAERASGRGIVFAVSEFLTQRLVGTVHLYDTDWRLRSTEIGYVTAPWARGEGYASEAVLAIAQWLFQDQRFERLELRTAADNTASQMVAQKIGCISEGVLRNAGIVRSRRADGRWTESRTDLIVWSLLPEDLDGVVGRVMDDSGYATYPDWR
jgi:RimJ/RimL family protein N-acetyltransferase